MYFAKPPYVCVTRLHSAQLALPISTPSHACPPAPLQNSTVLNAANQAVPNRLFAGCQYPEKLESYAHRTAAPGSGVTLSADLRGTWCVHYDAFKGIAQVGRGTRGG